jgi:hypothetical protein
MNPRTSTLAVVACLAAGAALSPAAATAQTATPSMRVHAIFTGGRATSFHVGEVLQVDVRNSGGRKLTQVCFSPAPISRPACSGSGVAAPSQAGTTTISATLSDGTKLSRAFTIHTAATKVGGPRAVPATIRCTDMRLFGNYDRRHHRSVGVRGTLHSGDRVGLFNRIAPGKIFMWDYATNLGGFGTESCAQTGTA